MRRIIIPIFREENLMKSKVLFSMLCLMIGFGVRSQAQNTTQEQPYVSTQTEVQDETAGQYEVQYDAQADEYRMVARPGGGGMSRPGVVGRPGGGGFRPGPGPVRPGFGGRPGVGPGYRPGFGGPGFRPGYGGGFRPGFVPGWHGGWSRPGWYGGWFWRHDLFPLWWAAGLTFPLFYFVAEAPIGYWQCTAYDEGQNPFSASGLTQNAAAYNALYDCGGDDYAETCYIPENYCQRRLN
jgi:hypothetical protein